MLFLAKKNYSYKILDRCCSSFIKIFNLITMCGYKINNNILSQFSKINNHTKSEQNLVVYMRFNDNPLSLTRYNTKLLLELSLNKMKIYNFIASNATKLRLGNLKSVYSLIVISNFYENIYDILVKDIDNPDLKLTGEIIKRYQNRVEKTYILYKP